MPGDGKEQINDGRKEEENGKQDPSLVSHWGKT